MQDVSLAAARNLYAELDAAKAAKKEYQKLSAQETWTAQALLKHVQPQVAQQMAGHESARTTGLYDRRNDTVALDEVERVVY